MGLLGKSFTSKLKTMTTLAVSRIAILKNHRKARASYARSDVAQLLNLGYHDRALLRVEHWIAEQNMLDAFVMIEHYCNFLRERAEVLEKNKECPIDMKEATCSLIFASSRCGEFPELHKIQEILTSKFGKEFADHAVGLHNKNNNNVNSKMMQKLSSRRLTMEIKMKALKQIATEIGVTLNFEEDSMLINNMEKLNVDQRQEVEVETRKLTSSVVEDDDDDAPRHNKENKNQHDDDPENVIEKDNKYAAAAAAALEALELASFEMSKYSNHNNVYYVKKKKLEGKEKDEVIISKTNKKSQELEGKEIIQKQSALAEEEESHSSQCDEQHLKLDGNNEQLRDQEREEPDHSQAAIRWNPPQRFQTDHAVNDPIVRRPVMETTNFPKQIHTHHRHVDWKIMSVRTR